MAYARSVLSKHGHLRTVGDRTRAEARRLDDDAVALVAPPGPAREISDALPHAGILLHVAQHVVQGSGARRIGANTGFPKEELRSGLLIPLGDRRQPLDTSVDVVARYRRSRARGIGIKILVDLDRVIVVGISDAGSQNS